MPDLELYTLPGCAYCTRVEEKLEELDLTYEEHVVPAPHFQREAVKAVSGQTRVPVLVDNAHGIEGMPESRDIVAYLERTYGESSETDEAEA